MDLELARELSQEAEAKIVLFVMDGLGGLPHPETGRTELGSAWTPHLDRLAKESSCGLTVPVAPGVTPGSGPGHLALFGYDPLVYNVGRGVLEAAGIDFDLPPPDGAARGNFGTTADNGGVADRRAGRERCSARSSSPHPVLPGPCGSRRERAATSRAAAESPYAPAWGRRARGRCHRRRDRAPYPAARNTSPYLPPRPGSRPGPPSQFDAHGPTAKS